MTTPLAFLNGRLVPAGELTLSPTDAGFVSGATVTDFCRTYGRRLFRWPDHLVRFRRDCAACRVPLLYPDADLTAAADAVVAHNARPLPAGTELALVTFATPGPLGYMTGDPDTGPPTVGMHTFPLNPDRYRRFTTDGVTLAVVGRLPATDLLPAGAKHRSRLHWWLADHAARDPAGPFPAGSVATLLAADGTAPDTAFGGVLVVADGTVYRPPPGAALESVSVGVVGELCGRLGVPFSAARVAFDPPPADVSEVLLAGSGFGVAAVRAAVGPGWRREFRWPGPIGSALAEAWDEMTNDPPMASD